MTKILFKLLITSFLIFFTSCSSKVYQPGEIPTTKISDKKSSEELAKGLTSHFKEEGIKVHQSGKNYSRVQKVMNKLLVSANLATNTFPILILESDDLNAGVYAGKTVVVYQGLLDLVENDDQLSAVLAHELGHVLAEHHNDQGEEKRSKFLKVGSAFLGTIANVTTAYYTGSSNAGDLAGKVTSVSTNVVGYGAIVKSYGRTQEYQADDIGLSIMTKAGYNPNEAVKLWKLMEAKNVGSGNSFFSTHPKSKDRAERIEQRIPDTIKSLKS